MFMETEYNVVQSDWFRPVRVTSRTQMKIQSKWKVGRIRKDVLHNVGCRGTPSEFLQQFIKFTWGKFIKRVSAKHEREYIKRAKCIFHSCNNMQYRRRAEPVQQFTRYTEKSNHGIVWSRLWKWQRRLKSNLLLNVMRAHLISCFTTVQ
jgi:hypothetical protein